MTRSVNERGVANVGISGASTTDETAAAIRATRAALRWACLRFRSRARASQPCGCRTCASPSREIARQLLVASSEALGEEPAHIYKVDNR
jgi:hypothetical protein